jgi:mannose-6-phosphate isomerase-like protein (cupin superfamily)
MAKDFNYDQRMDIKYGPMELIDIPGLVEDCRQQWFNQSLTTVNGSVVRLGIIEGDYHWHKHDDDDEFFFVLSGKLIIELEDRTIELNPQQGTTVPKGVMHRPRAPRKTVMLMVETESIDPIGDVE